MKKTQIALIFASFVYASAASAAVRTYQVTGPVLEVTDSAIVVQKGSEKWEIARDVATGLRAVHLSSRNMLIRGARIDRHRMDSSTADIADRTPTGLRIRGHVRTASDRNSDFHRQS